jgi:hypothetical protein
MMFQLGFRGGEGMDKWRFTTVLTIALMAGYCLDAFGQDKPSLPSESYLGQAPATTKPEIFAPDIISDAGYRLHGAPAFSPAGDEVFWPVIPPAIMHMARTDSGWAEPREYPVNMRGLGSPVFSRDGSRLYFQGAGADGYGSIDIWYLERRDNGWSDPLNLGSLPNTAAMESQPSFTNTGDLYYTGSLDSVGMNRGIYVSRFVDSAYTKAELLGGAINTPSIDYTPFVAADGRYLLFASSRPTIEESELKLYVSFSTGNGGWSAPKNLSAALGLTASARFPAVSPDGDWLFFLSEGRVYWVSAEVIDRLQTM